MKVLIVDDSAERYNKLIEILRTGTPTSITIVAHSDLAIRELEKEDYWDLIILDHDLGAYSQSGAQVANYIMMNGIRYGRLIVDSINPVGAKNICAILEDAEHIPYPVLIKNDTLL